MRTVLTPLLLALLACAGCNLIVNDECNDKQCDEARWLIINSGRGRVRADAGGDCSGSYTVEFVKPEARDGFILDTSLSVRHTDLRVAITTNDGVLHLADFGAATANAERADDFALAAAWSPTGDELAILAGDPAVEPLDLELLIFDDALDLLSVTALGAHPGFQTTNPTAHHIAWSPSGAWLAVTGDQDVEGRLVNPATDEVIPLTARRAEFLAEDTLVVEAGDAVLQRELEKVVFADGAVQSRRSLQIPEYLLDADAETDVLLTIVEGPYIYDRALRTEALGPNRLGTAGGDGEYYALIPLTHEVSQALTASGVLNCAP